ncbi:hypothetical protein [Mycolicibacterium thermoresistibile]
MVDDWFERSPFVGFVPWIIYWVVAGGPSTWQYGAMCALLAAFILGVSMGRGRPKLLDVVTMVFFFAVTVVGTVVGAQDRDWMDTHAITLSSGALAVITLASLGFVPFTEQYTRAPSAAHRSAFRRVNRVLTAMWGLAFGLIAVLGLIGVRAPETAHWMHWVIPVVVITGAVAMTQVYPQRVRARLRPASG